MPDKGPSRPAAFALAGICVFTICILALHGLRPDLDPLAYTTSHYANGAFGWLMIIAFVSMSAATAALVAALARAVAPTRMLTAGCILLSLWAVGVLVAAVFPIDPPGERLTLVGRIHRINGPIAFLALTIGIITSSLALLRDAAWVAQARTVRTLIALIVAGWLFGAVTVPTGSDLAGLAQRASLILVVAWYLLVATKIFRSARIAA